MTEPRRPEVGLWLELRDAAAAQQLFDGEGDLPYVPFPGGGGWDDAIRGFLRERLATAPMAVQFSRLADSQNLRDAREPRIGAVFSVTVPETVALPARWRWVPTQPS